MKDNCLILDKITLSKSFNVNNQNEFIYLQDNLALHSEHCDGFSWNEFD